MKILAAVMLSLAAGVVAGGCSSPSGRDDFPARRNTLPDAGTPARSNVAADPHLQRYVDGLESLRNDCGTIPAPAGPT